MTRRRIDHNTGWISPERDEHHEPAPPPSFEIDYAPDLDEAIRRYQADRHRAEVAAGHLMLGADEDTIVIITPDPGDSMLNRFAARLFAYILAAAAIVTGTWWAIAGRRGSGKIEPPKPWPAPPTLDDERAEVVAEVGTMDRDQLVDELTKRGH